MPQTKGLPVVVPLDYLVVRVERRLDCGVERAIRNLQCAVCARPPAGAILKPHSVVQPTRATKRSVSLAAPLTKLRAIQPSFEVGPLEPWVVAPRFRSEADAVVKAPETGWVLLLSARRL